MESFRANFCLMPWLAIPFTHAQRRARLRSLFQVDGACTLVLLNQLGQTITREGAKLFELAQSCQNVLALRTAHSKESKEQTALLEKERAKMQEVLSQLKPVEDTVKRAAKRLNRLRPHDLKEISDFVSETKIAPKVHASAHTGLRPRCVPLPAIEKLLG
eukprot:581466-Pleurochrysis_carterae.AAC.2